MPKHRVSNRSAKPAPPKAKSRAHAPRRATVTPEGEDELPLAAPPKPAAKLAPRPAAKPAPRPAPRAQTPAPRPTAAAPRPQRKPKPKAKPKPAREPRGEEKPPIRIPRWIVTSIIGAFLLVPAFLLSQTFFQAFSHATAEQGLHHTEEFRYFAIGFGLWVFCFGAGIWIQGHPSPLRVYIYGHELTHAIWVYLFGGRVSAFKVHRDGGYILTDKTNVWIALAPYFYPIYSLAVVVLYGMVSLFYDVLALQEQFLGMTPLQWLFFLLGNTWAFHLTFTCWIIPKGQSDLKQYGTLFSLVLIYTLNVAVLALALVSVAPEVTWAGFGQDLWQNTVQLLEALTRLWGRLFP